jgi:type I restriction-modification system DNA methylase subunit
MANSKSSAAGAQSTLNLEFKFRFWLRADKLRNSMGAVEYKYVVLGLIAPKYILDTSEEHRTERTSGQVWSARLHLRQLRRSYDYKAENVFWRRPTMPGSSISQHNLRNIDP